MSQSKAGKVRLHRTRVERHVYGAYFPEDGGMIEKVKCILHI